MESPFKDMEQHNRVPRGFLILLFGLIAWGLYYIAAYTPQFSGWSQYTTLRADLILDQKRAASSAVMLENPYEHDEKSVEEGKSLYAKNCADCHGKDLKGGDGGPSLAGHLKYGEEDSRKYQSISKGLPGGMPPFETELGRDRIWKVLAYVDSVREYGKKP